MRKIKSRILEVFDNDILIEMYKLQSKRFANRMFKGQNIRTEYSANMKVKDMTKLLSEYLGKKGFSYSFPGAGTNRMTVLINGYIYKIALDQDGYIDNLNEFIMSKEAQPYVTKTYETNGLLAVAEYVTLISYEEFVEKKARILEILDDISREYLIGDMGWTQKNYTNWGYRKNSDDLVILDFGHMHRLSGEKLLCRECGQILQYNSTFTKLKCLSCGKEEEFMTIKSRLSKKEERENIDNYLERAYVLNTPEIEIKEDEVKDMSMYENFEEEELVSRRFKRFAPKKGKYDHLLERRAEDARTISTLEDLPDEVNDKVREEYMKVVQGKVKIKKTEEEPQENKQILDPIKEEISEMDNDEAIAYIYSLFIRDEINSEQYDYYTQYIEHGEEEDHVVESEIVMDVINTEEPEPLEEEDEFYDEDSDKTFVFDDDDLGIETTESPTDIMLTMINKKSDKSINTKNDVLEDGSFSDFMAKFKDDFIDTGDEEFQEDEEEEEVNDNRIYLSSSDDNSNENETEVEPEIEPEPEVECSLKLKSSGEEEVVEVKAYQMALESSDVEEVEMTVKIKEPEKNSFLSQDEINKFKRVVGTKDDKKEESVSNVKLYDTKQDNNDGVSLKVKPSSEIKAEVIEPKDEVGLKVIEQNKFNDGSIFLKMREMQEQRQRDLEEEKDYSHYEEEYAHLLEDMDDYPTNRGGNRNNWR